MKHTKSLKKPVEDTTLYLPPDLSTFTPEERLSLYQYIETMDNALDDVKEITELILKRK